MNFSLGYSANYNYMYMIQKDCKICDRRYHCLTEDQCFYHIKNKQEAIAARLENRLKKIRIAKDLKVMEISIIK